MECESVLLESNRPLSESDSELFDIIQREKRRQKCSLNLTANENYASRAVLQAMSCCFHNKFYRIYGYEPQFDDLVPVCQRRCLDAFHLNNQEWRVSVECYSASFANFVVYMGVAGSHGRILVLNLAGDASHSTLTPAEDVCAASHFFELVPFDAFSSASSELIDYEQLANAARLVRPKLIVAGMTSYPKSIDYKRLRDIARETGAVLMADISPISGLVAAQVVQSQIFQLCDVVTTTTHNSLRGPQAGLIFYKKDLESRIEAAVYPGFQGGPHINTITAIAVAMKDTSTPDFSHYQLQVLTNAKALARSLAEKGYTCLTGDTENHLVWLDVRPNNLDGTKVKYILEEVSIECTSCTIPDKERGFGDGGVQFGVTALTTRGLIEKDIKTVADFIDEGMQLAIKANGTSPTPGDVSQTATNKELNEELQNLRLRVENFAGALFMAGFENQ